MNHIAYFEIQSSEPKKLAEFYNQVFGWNFEKDVNIPIEYYRTTSIKEAGILGAILQRPAPVTSQGTNAYTCSIEVESFDATAEKILKLGGIVALDKFAIPGRCWQGYFQDPDKNVFGIFEVDENAK
jgi:predicted enzyme related to lactoylglutathione lyase